MPDCVSHCSYVSLHKRFLRYNTRQEQLLLDLTEVEKRQLFTECEKQCRIDSRSVNHNRYFNDEFQKYCHSQLATESETSKNDEESSFEQFGSKVKTILAKPDESCHQACSRLDEDPLSMLPG